MMVGKLHSFWEGNFSGAMLNFRWVKEAEAKFSLQSLELLISATILPLFKEYPYTHLSAPIQGIKASIYIYI